jgi:glycosyltransferase involved in cell wall biosynthesis
MVNNPLISCIIIFFNAGEQFLIEAIESVFAQTYTNWELLLVDDGSTDGSTAIALQYVQKYPQQVRYLEHAGHENLGMSATRNLGIHYAKGEYITFLDADDCWLCHTLEDQTTILEAHPEAAMVYGSIQFWYSWTGNPEDIARDFIDTPEVFLRSPKTYIDTILQPPNLFLLLLQMKIGISGMLVRRQAIDQVGRFEEQFRGLYEDQVFCAKICLEFPVFVSYQCWYYYRQHPDSCCAIAEKAKKQDWQLQRLAFLNWVEQYLSTNGHRETSAWQTVQKELWSYRHPILSFPFNQIQRISSRIKQKCLKLWI